MDDGDPSRDLEKPELSSSSSSSPSSSHFIDTPHDAADPSSATATASTSGSFQSLDNDEDNDMSRIQTVQTQRSTQLERNLTALSRIATHRSQHSATVGASLRTRPTSKSPMPEFGAGKPYPPMLPSMDDYVVEFAGLDDPLHPQNWSTAKK